MEQRKKKQSRLFSLFLALAVSLSSVSALPAGAEDAADIQPAITTEEAPETSEAPATAEATAEAPATAEATAETTETTAETAEAVEGTDQEEPVKSNETFTMLFTSTRRTDSTWSYDGGDFDISKFDQTIKASTWEWYGAGDTDKGYPAKTLVLKDGFNFSTSTVNAIEIEGNATIIIQGECTVSGLVHSIFCSGNAVIKSDVNSDETVIGTLNADENIKADKTLKISGVNIVSEPTIASAYCVIEAKTVDLSECDITVGGAWKDQTIIYSSDNTIIRRGVRLDIPAGVIALGSVNYSYIAEVDEIENIKLNNGTELTVDNFQCEIMDGSSFAAVDDSKRMTLHTAEFSVSSEDHYLYDESVSDPDKGKYCLLGGETYSFDLNDFLDEKTLKACTLYLSTYDDRGDSLTSPKLEGTTVSITPRDSSASGYTLYLNLLDDKMEYSSGNTRIFKFCVGEVLEMKKLSFYHEGDYVMGEAHKTYSISVSVNGKELKEYDEGKDSHYFMIPSGREFTFTLMPEDGYKLEKTEIWLSENRKHQFVLYMDTASYAIDEDCTFLISISRTSVPQYIKVDVSDELRKMLTDGRIKSVELLTAGKNSTVLDSETDQFPINLMNSDVLNIRSQIKICVSSEDIDGESQPAYGVKSICGISNDIKYDNNSKIYNLSSMKFNADTAITAEIGRLCDISTLHTNADNSSSVYLVNCDYQPNTNGRYYVGDEYGIMAFPVNGKLFGSATFNGKKIKMDNEDNGYWHFKVVPEEGSNEFVLNYSDISTLRITKPENGTIEFQSDIGLIGGRGSETLEDGTQVYTLGTWDKVTLTLTPDSGYKLKSATLDGKAVTITDNQYTFNIEKLADWTFSAEFVEKPEIVTVTVDCGEHGKVTPGTSEYEKGTDVTLTVTPDSGYKVKSVTLDGKAVTLTNGKYTFTVQADCVFKAEFEKTSAPGGGGSGGRPTRPATPTNDNKPTINGNPGSWSSIEASLRSLPAGSSAVISLNGEVKIPAEVISAIASGKLMVEFVVDTAKSWLVSGADITAPCEADLSLMQGRADSSALRGVTGADLIVNGTKIPAKLLLKFRSEFAGKFANVYTLSGGALKFLGCEKLGTDGSVTISGANGAGEYIVMLCELSDLPGDMNNDGVLNALDAAAILKDIVKSSEGENPLMADLDGNGKADALDAAAVLKLVTLN